MKKSTYIFGLIEIYFRAITGHPTQFMKILHYTLFVVSPSVKKYILSKGVDPDTVYLNDLKFMQRVFHILVCYIFQIILNFLNNSKS